MKRRKLPARAYPPGYFTAPVRAWRGAFGPLWSPRWPELVAESRRIAGETGRDEMRVFDGRLQALRRCGAIAYRARKDGGRGWELT